MSAAENQIITIVNNLLNKLKSNNKPQQYEALKKAFAKSDRFAPMAYHLGVWKQEYLTPYPHLHYLLKKEMQQLKDYFTEKEVIDYFELKKEYRYIHYYYEIAAITIGILMIHSGVIDEINKIVSVGLNYKFQTVVRTGALTAFYGFLAMFCGIISILHKIKKRP